MWPNPQKTADLVTFVEEILNGKPHFLCSVITGGDFKSKGKNTDKLPDIFWVNEMGYIFSFN